MTRRYLHLLLALAVLGAVLAAIGMLADRRRWEVVVHADELVTEAQQLSAAGSRDEARARVKEALRIAPDYHRALREEALHLIAWDKPDEALVLLRRAAEAQPDDSRAARELAAPTSRSRSPTKPLFSSVAPLRSTPMTHPPTSPSPPFWSSAAISRRG